MKPFGLLIAERSNNPERCVDMANRFLQRYKDVSGSRSVSLEETSWIAALLHLGMVAAQENMKQQAALSTTETVNENGARVVTVVATSEAMTHDEAG